MKKLLAVGWVTVCAVVVHATVSVSNLEVSQQEGAKLVHIYFDVSNDLTNTVDISVLVSNGVAAIDASSLSGDVGFGVTTGSMKHIIWNAEIDWNGNVSVLSYTIVADDGVAAAPVTKTGQIVSYRTGDDGDLEKGTAWPSPRFIDHGDGTIADNLTGLNWVKNPHSLAGNTDVLKWHTAIAFCAGLDYASHTNWHLPTRNELASLVDHSQYDLALPVGHPFVGILNDSYWSSTTLAYDTTLVWYLSTANGFMHSNDKAWSYNLAWPVRDGGAETAALKTGQTISYRSGDDGDLEPGIAWPAVRIVGNPAGTVTDKLTGLEWVQAPHLLAGNESNMVWNSAIDFCNGLDYAGHADWRMPNIKELESLMHCGSGAWGNRPYQWLNNETPIMGIQADYYWVSTTTARVSDYAWAFNMDVGYINSSYPKTAILPVWPVRGGQ